MYKHAICVFLFCCGSITTLISQTSEVELIFTDRITREPLVGATVRINDIGRVTDLSGKLRLNLAVGKHTAHCSYIGYKAKTFELDIAKADQSYVFEVSLNQSSLLLETATVTSSRTRTSLSEVTVSMDVIKPEFLRNNNATSLDAVLDRVPGVQIIDGQANIRGGSGYSYGAGSRVMVLLDDIPVLQADAGFPNWRDLPIENVGQIEVLKGAGSALYGSAALNGIINMKTNYAKSEPETEALLFTTVLDRPANESRAWWDKAEAPISYGGHFVHRRKWKKLDFSGGAYYLNRESHYKDAYNRAARAYLNLRYRFSDRFTGSISAMVNSGENRSFFYWDGAGSLTGSPNALSSGSYSRIYLDPRLNFFDKFGNHHKFLGRWMYVNNDNNNNQGNTSNWFYGEYQYNRSLLSDKLNISSGLLGVVSWTDSPLFLNSKIGARNYASYVQAEIQALKDFKITAGARFEYNELLVGDVPGADTISVGNLQEGKPVFRLGATYKLATATFLRASWGQGYRFPTIAEKFISTNAGVLNVTSNPGLQSESGWTSEVGIKQGFHYGGFSGYFDFSVFWSRYMDMMEFTLIFDGSDFSFQSQNIGDTQIRGLECSVVGQGKIGGIALEMLLGYTYLDPRFEEFDLSGNDIPINERDMATAGQLNAANSSVDYNVLKYRSKHQVKSDLQFTWKNYKIGYALRHASHVEAVDRIFEQALPGVREFRESNNKGYWVHDVRLGVQFYEAHRLSLIVANIGNASYTVRPGLLEPPRSLTLQYMMSF